MVSHRVLPNTGESELSDVPIYSNDRNGHTTMTTTSTSPSLPSSSKSTNSRQSVGGVEETESLVGKAGTLSGNICGMAKINLLDCMDVCDHLILRKPDEDGPKIKGGSTDALVVHATIAGKSEFIFQEAFLTTYRTFLSHKQLISKLLYRFNQFRKILTGNRKIAQSVFSLLIRVIDELCMTELEDDLFKGQFSLVYDLLCEGELCLAKLLRRKLLEKWAKRQVVIGQARTIIRPIDSVSLQYSSAHDFLNFKPLDIAEQMTLLDARLFLNIEVQEVLLWAKEQSEEQSPNLTTFTEHFNKMSYWCRTQILTQDDAKEREKYLNKMIKIMRNLRKLKNFNSYLAILSALDSAPVRRLQWQKQNVEALHEVCQLIDSSSSFRTYRYALADTEPPCIPYLGLILQDLTFINIGNKDCLPDGRVNFNKRWQQFNVLDSMRRFKTTLYSLKRSEKIQAVLNNFDDYCSEDVLWQISQQIKPRQSHQKQHSLP